MKVKKRPIIIVTVILLTVLLAVLLLPKIQENNEVKDSEAFLKVYQNDIFQYMIEDQTIPVYSCWVSYDNQEGEYYLYIEGGEVEGVDYDAYLKKINEHFGEEFNIRLELQPFPSEPSIEGIIQKIDKEESVISHILIISDKETLPDGQPDAMRVSINDGLLVVDANDNAFDLSTITVGMRVASYYRGMTLDTYPGQQGSEKLVVYTDFELEPLSFVENQDLFEQVFKGGRVSQSLVCVGDGWQYEKQLEEPIATTVQLNMFGGHAYFEMDRIQEGPAYYENEIQVYVKRGSIYLENPYTLDSTIIHKDFEPEFRDVNEDGDIDFGIPYLVEGELINRYFSIDTSSGKIYEMDIPEELQFNVVKRFLENLYDVRAYDKETMDKTYRDICTYNMIERMSEDEVGFLYYEAAMKDGMMVELKGYELEPAHWGSGNGDMNYSYTAELFIDYMDMRPSETIYEKGYIGVSKESGTWLVYSSWNSTFNDVFKVALFDDGEREEPYEGIEYYELLMGTRDDGVYIRKPFEGNYSQIVDSIVRTQGQDITTIMDFSPSMPEISPDGSAITFVDVLEFEVNGNACVYGLDSSELVYVTVYEQGCGSSVKNIEWLDDDTLLLIIGFDMGTITRGGNLYKYSLLTDTLELVMEAEEMSEIVDIEVKDYSLWIQSVEWLDDNFMDYKYNEMVIDKDEI